MLLFTPFLDAALCSAFIKHYNQEVSRLLGRVFCRRPYQIPSTGDVTPKVAAISDHVSRETQNTPTILTNYGGEIITTNNLKPFLQHQRQNITASTT